MSALFPGGSSLAWPDYFVLIFLFAAMLGCAWSEGARWKKSGDFFSAGRALSWPRACASLIASEISALALLSLAASTFSGDWSDLRLFIAAAAARLCIVWLYLPIVYPAAGATVYGYLAKRFGPATRRVSAGFFIGMRLLASGARLAAAAGVVGALLGCHPVLVLLALALACAAYTSRGGLSAVSGAAVVQAGTILAAPFVLLAFLSRHWPGGFSAAIQAAHDAGRLGLGSPRTALALSPAFFAALATYGADQELAQNSLAAASLKDSRWATAGAAVLSLLIGAAYLAVGTGLFAFYKLNPAMSPPQSPSLVYAHFCLTSLPVAVRGLSAAAIVMAAAHLPLCSLSAAFVEDYYRPWLMPRKSEAHYLRVSKAAVWFFAAALAGLAIIWNSSEAWLAFLLKIGSMLLGPLLGVFLFALFSRRWADRANVVAAASSAGLGAVAVALIEADRLHCDPSWLIVFGALFTAFLARQLAPYLDRDQ
jgi:Na+/proline symporter